jgi:hypothetical protein
MPNQPSLCNVTLVAFLCLQRFRSLFALQQSSLKAPESSASPGPLGCGVGGAPLNPCAPWPWILVQSLLEHLRVGFPRLSWWQVCCAPSQLCPGTHAVVTRGPLECENA